MDAAPAATRSPEEPPNRPPPPGVREAPGLLPISELRPRVHAAIATALGLDASSIRDETRFLYDLEVDSIAVLEIVCALEEELGLEVDELEALPVESVGELVQALAASPLHGAARP